MIPAGVYEFKYTVAGWCDSEDEATFTITINDIPDSPEVSPNQQVCVGADLQLTAIGNVSYSYQWLGPNGFTSNEQNPLIENISLSQNGIYTVSASDNGCGSASVSTELIIDSIPNFTVDAECVNNAYTLSVIPNNGDLPADATYTWSGPENFTASGNPIVITHLPSGIYSVIVSSSGCEATAPITVGGTFCTFPLGISPNDDGDNDTFDLSGFDIEYIKIFNRYGMVVYDKLNYLKEWDGKDYNGNNLPSATYYYYARFRSGEEKTGWVYLIRR
jgi:gliding motility-associated-like protein